LLTNSFLAPSSMLHIQFELRLLVVMRKHDDKMRFT
jgi:hypothetical protein